jgi:hypothetical protein
MELRTALVIAGSTFLAGVIRAWWSNFKERKALQPTPLKFRNGVYTPWGTVEKIKHYGWRFAQLWFVYVSVLVLALIYVKLISPNL